MSDWRPARELAPGGDMNECRMHHWVGGAIDESTTAPFYEFVDIRPPVHEDALTRAYEALLERDNKGAALLCLKKMYAVKCVDIFLTKLEESP